MTRLETPTPRPEPGGAAPAEPLPGRFRVAEVVQADQLGVVYRVVDLAEDAPRLVRVWAPFLANDAEFRARLRQLTGTVTALGRHAALPGVFTAEDTPGSGLLLVTDAAPVPTLGDRLSGEPLPVRRALRLAVRIGEALEALHNAGLAHGYLAPAYIAFGELDDQIRFRGLEYSALPPRLTRTLDLAAAPFDRAYAPPEQQDAREATEAADIYAYGRLLWDLLAGAAQATGGRRRRLTPGPRRLSPLVRRVIESALAATPAERPQGIGEMLNDLWSELAGEPAETPSRPGSRRYRPGLLGLGAAMIAIALLLTVRGSVGPQPEAQGPISPPTVEQSRQLAAGGPGPSPVAVPAPAAAPLARPDSMLESPESSAAGTTPAAAVPAAAPRALPAPPATSRLAPATAARRWRPPKGPPISASGAVVATPGTNDSAATLPGAAADRVPEPPGRTGGRRWRDADVSPDPGSIIDWLLNGSRAGTP